eukprot:12012550-Heterocapsa_arctica.AAC.1
MAVLQLLTDFIPLTVHVELHAYTAGGENIAHARLAPSSGELAPPAWLPGAFLQGGLAPLARPAR